MMRVFLLTISTILIATGCRSAKLIDNYGIVFDSVSDDVKKDIVIIEFEQRTGVIFPKEFELNFNRERLSKRFTPTEKEIREMESQIGNQYFESDKRFAYHQNFYNYTNDSNWTVQDRQIHFKLLMNIALKEAQNSIEFDRQYIGFIENNQRIILIQFLDFAKDPYGLKKNLTRNFISGWHGWFETNRRLKEYNLETKRLNAFGWPNL